MFGEKLIKMRKSANLTQEEVATHLGVSPQAVSKWENDLSCPDIMLLPRIAKLYGTSVDELLSENTPEINIAGEKAPEEKKHIEYVVPESTKENGELKFLKVNVLSQFGDKVNVKLPITLIKTLKSFLSSIKLDKNLTGGVGIDLSDIDFDEIFELVDRGVIGEIVNVVTQNGDVVKLYVETE